MWRMTKTAEQLHLLVFCLRLGTVLLLAFIALVA